MGLSVSGAQAALRSTALGGREGSDLSNSIVLLLVGCGGLLCRLEAFLCDFFLRLCIRFSWHSMQNMPCDVLAYLRFSIFLLQFRHLKQFAQKAWSPVRIAKSSILSLQTLQLYVQLLQMSEPSPRRRRFASESRMVLQVLHLKQSMCHRFPAGRESV